MNRFFICDHSYFKHYKIGIAQIIFNKHITYSLAEKLTL